MRKTQIVLATGEVYDVEDKGEKRILIPVGYIKQEEEKHEQSDFDVCVLCSTQDRCG